MEYLNVGAVIGCYLAIIGVYVWVFRQIQEVKNEMLKHVGEYDVHTDSDKLVFRDVCDQKVLRIEGKVDDLKNTVTTELREIKKFMQNNKKEG